ncbi:MAG: ATP-binding cassette domain-containing protein, partial [Candidatus Sumerlaeaceae bacterium]|nr:ATP-binding cassette domain-containing protein [Candidatus Sumerlaeaceae bacterium]
ILAGLGFMTEEMDNPLASFSGGWQMRAHIARLLLERPDLLMLDEPTNHLDLESIEWLEGFLVGFPGALIVVSHDRYFLDRITTKTAWLFQRRLRNFTGNYSKFLVQREQDEEHLRREYENQLKEIAHVQEFIDRFRYKASKAAAVQSRVKMLEKIERIELPPSARKVRLKIPEPAPCGRRVLDLQGVGKAYGTNRVFNSVDLLVERGDKIALVGRNGAGKSTLLKISAGVLDYEGTRLHDSKMQVEYFSQHRIDNLNLDNTVLEESRPPGATQTDEELRSLLGCFLFTGEDVFKPVRVLSGGEKSRLALARMMLRRGNLLCLDEPTNHLDISTREVLQNALREFPGSIIMISHDRYFIDALATKIVEVGGGGIKVHLGNYSDFLATTRGDANSEVNLRGGLARGATAGSRQKPGKVDGTVMPSNSSGALAAIELAKLDNKESKRLTTQQKQERNRRRAALRTRIKELESSIESTETRLAEIHALQSDPRAYASGLITPELGAEAKKLETELPALISEWEQSSEEYEELESYSS